MTTSAIPLARLTKELKVLRTNPPDGVLCWPRHGSNASDGPMFDQDGGFLLDVSMTGPAGTVYEGGTFQLACRLPPDYPVVPPHVKFLTRVYHPNVDRDGRICLPVLKEGNEPDRWNAVKCNVRSALALIRQLLAEPNADDPLDADAAKQMKHDPIAFQKKAREWTKLYATANLATTAADSDVRSDQSAMASSTANQEEKSVTPRLNQHPAPVATGWSSIALGTSTTLGGGMSGSLLTGSGILGGPGRTSGLLGGGIKSSTFSAGASSSSSVGLAPPSTRPSNSVTPTETKSTNNISATDSPSNSSASATRVSPIKPSLIPSSKRSREPDPAAPESLVSVANVIAASSTSSRAATPTDERPTKKIRHAHGMASAAPPASMDKENKLMGSLPPLTSALPQPNQQRPNTDPRPPSPLPPAGKSAQKTPFPPVSTEGDKVSDSAAPSSLAPSPKPSLLGTSNPAARPSLGGGLLGSVHPAAGTGGLLSRAGGGLLGSGGNTPAMGLGLGAGGLLGRASAAANGGPVPRTGLLGSSRLLGTPGSSLGGSGGSIFGGKSGLFTKKSSS